jgi:hypothetical protein
MDMECGQMIIPCSTPPQDLGPQPPSISHTQEPDQPAHDSPNFDFYNDCYSFSPLLYAFFFVAMVVGVKYTVGASAPSDTSQIFSLVYLYFSVLAASVLCRRKPASFKARTVVWTLCFMSYSAIVGYGWIGNDYGYGYGYGVFLPALGWTCLALLILVEWKTRHAKGGLV